MDLAKLRWLARAPVRARVSDGFRCVLDWGSSSAVGKLFDSVSCGGSSEIDGSAVAAVGISLVSAPPTEASDRSVLPWPLSCSSWKCCNAAAISSGNGSDRFRDASRSMRLPCSFDRREGPGTECRWTADEQESDEDEGWYSA